MDILGSEIDSIGTNRIVRALGIRLKGFINLSFGSSECAERELFSGTKTRSSPQFSEVEDGYRMLRIFIENYDLIAKKAEWQSRLPLLCAQIIEVWLTEQRNNNTDLMFLAALRELLDVTCTLGAEDEIAVLIIG